MKYRYGFIAVALIATLVTAVARKVSAPAGWPDNDDKSSLKFSHAHHVTELGAACIDCHKGASTSTKASDNLRSNHESCVGCHEEQINNACAYCHKDTTNMHAAAAPERDIAFSHKQHIEMTDVACTTCHQGLEKADYAGPANMPVMASCTTCHNDIRATKTCEACHTNFVNLIPDDHLVADFKKDHKRFTRLGSLEVRCVTCHSQDFCAGCHAGGELLQLGNGALMTEPSPRNNAGKEGPKKMTLQTVHSMNYRYTHGIDARAKSSDCFTCHSAQDFCARCHAEGDRLTPGQVPASHIGSGFTTLGVGSGGGRHAELARRDIESCMTCHDARGGDPVCITCHVDADGIRGTDPKTHPAGFAGSQDHGSWHTDPGATCYNCHTDMNAHPGGVAGKGFCGYCHGPKRG